MRGMMNTQQGHAGTDDAEHGFGNLDQPVVLAGERACLIRMMLSKRNPAAMMTMAKGVCSIHFPAPTVCKTISLTVSLQVSWSLHCASFQ